MILGISTASTMFEVVLGDKGKILYSSSYNLTLNRNKDISDLVVEGMDDLGITFKDILNLIVNVGPGGTSLVRTGVAFANGLSYSLNIPISPASSLELLGYEAWEKYQLPVLCTVKSIKDNAYVTLYKGDMQAIKYGNLTGLCQEMTADLEEFVVGGHHNTQLIEMFKFKKVQDSGLQNGKAKFLIEKFDFWKGKSVSFPNFAHPITEQTAQVE
jgi:tRNA A37 threonylcarbamoyladenosine modification protein TsaB